MTERKLNQNNCPPMVWVVLQTNPVDLTEVTEIRPNQGATLSDVMAYARASAKDGEQVWYMHASVEEDPGPLDGVKCFVCSEEALGGTDRYMVLWVRPV